MILIDVNLLLYAYHGSPSHDRAKLWAEEVLSQPDPVGLAWVTILAFLRISTVPGVLEAPVSMAEAAKAVSRWLAQPQVRILHPGERHWEILHELMAVSQVRGRLVTDAHLAALAIEHGATLHTNDLDFKRFPGLKLVYPLQNS